MSNVQELGDFCLRQQCFVVIFFFLQSWQNRFSLSSLPHIILLSVFSVVRLTGDKGFNKSNLLLKKAWDLCRYNCLTVWLCKFKWKIPGKWNYTCVQSFLLAERSGRALNSHSSLPETCLFLVFQYRLKIQEAHPCSRTREQSLWFASLVHWWRLKLRICFISEVALSLASYHQLCPTLDGEI